VVRDVREVREHLLPGPVDIDVQRHGIHGPEA
jgi:hypothetical protein